MTDAQTKRKLLTERVNLKAEVRARYKRIDAINDRLLSIMAEEVEQQDARTAAHDACYAS